MFEILSTLIYNAFMLKLQAKELIKLLLSIERVKQKDLVKMLSDKTGKEYTPDGLAHKIGRGSITYNEVLLITDILGYDIKVERRNLT